MTAVDTAAGTAELTNYSLMVHSLVAAARAAVLLSPGEEIDAEGLDLLHYALRVALDATQAETDPPSPATFIVDDDPQDETTIAELIEVNEDSPLPECELLELTLLTVGQSVTFGGGAVATVKLTRVR